jgi:hypothetical protein
MILKLSDGKEEAALDMSGSDRVTLGNLSGQRISMQTGNGTLCCGRRGDEDALRSEKWLEVVYQQGQCDWKPEPDRETDGTREQEIAPEPEISREQSCRDFEYEVSRNDDGLSFTAFCGNVACIGAWKPHEWGFELKAAVKNTGVGIIHSVRFRLDGLNMPVDSIFALPHGAGFIVPLSDLAPQEDIKLHYPVFCSMQWLDVFTCSHGIYMGVCDETPRSKIFAAGMNMGSPYMEVRFADLQIKPHEAYALPPMRLMAHEGDWRTGAGNYRNWFESVFTKPAVPEWCLESPAWAWALCKQQYAETPVLRFNQLPEHGGSFAGHGISTLQISGYMENGHDTMFPDYGAGDCMGGQEGLRAAVNQIHGNGGRLALYTNGRLADPASGIGKQPGWADWCVTGLSPEQLEKMNAELRFGARNPDLHAETWDVRGIRYKEKYGQVTFAVMCPSSRPWREHYIRKVVDLARICHPDGIYLDQVCGAWGLSCYGSGHDHARPCDAWCGYVKLLGDLRTEMREIAPGAYLATEGVNDILGINIDIFQAHDWGFRFGLPKSAKPSPDIFISTHPDYLLFLGPVFKNDVIELRRAFAYGRGLDIAIENIEECDKAFVEELDFVMKSRHMTCPGLLAATPQPVPVCEGICCFLFMLPDGNPVVLGSVLGNMPDVQQDIRLPILPEFSGRQARVFTPGREMLVDADMGIVIDGSAGLWMIGM